MLAACLPAASFDLVESVGRKCDFLREAIERMGLENASVVCERSEEWAGGDGREADDAVTARAVGSLATLAELASPLLVEGGVLAAWKGARSEAEEAEVARAASNLAMEPARDAERAALRRSRDRHIHLLRKNGPTPNGLPRRPGMAAKRPFGLRTALTRTIRMGTVYAIANQKGGVGKTTTAVNMGACVRPATRPADPDRRPRRSVQRNGCAWSALRTRRRRPTTASSGEVSVGGGRSPGWAGQPVDSSRPCGSGWGRRSSCRASSGDETRLRDGLGPVRSRFAYTLLDCPPSLGLVAVNALVAADKVIVPVQAEYLALEGLVQFLDTLKLVRRELNPDLEDRGGPDHDDSTTAPA